MTSNTPNVLQIIKENVVKAQGLMKKVKAIVHEVINLYSLLGAVIALIRSILDYISKVLIAAKEEGLLCERAAFNGQLFSRYEV